MLGKIKKFVKSVSSTTWMIIAVGVVAFVILSLSNCHGKPHKKHGEAKAHVEAPAAQ
jgi:hypothetical protein